MSEPLKTVLLLALPASGKSEVRRYLRHLSPEQCAQDFSMGPTVQLDDFPYVHIMRCIDQALTALQRPTLFFQAPDKQFLDGRDWGTLVQLVNEDYDDMVNKRVAQPKLAAELMCERLDRASTKVGLQARLAQLDAETRAKVIEALEEESASLLSDKHKGYPDSLEGKTVVIEFARGGPDGSDMPLPSPLGYRYSISQLSPEILADAVVLYVWVTPEESRRKNDARTDPNDPGSILHHGVPISVMLGDYGCDDMDWLEANSSKPGTLAIEAQGKKYFLPVGRFDNRVDKTSFLRDDPDAWDASAVDAIHQGMKAAFDKIKASNS